MRVMKTLDELKDISFEKNDGQEAESRDRRFLSCFSLWKISYMYAI